MVHAGFNTVAAVLTLISVVFLILATISTPVAKSLVLSITDSHHYGVFGYCYGFDTACTTTYPYNLNDAHDKTNDWLLTGSDREALGKMVIIAPIAAFLNLVAFVLIVVTHFKSRASVLMAIVVDFFATIVTALITIVIILIFWPHVAWGGWLVLGAGVATLLSLICLFVSLKFHDASATASDDESTSSVERWHDTLDEKPNQFASSFGGPTTGFSSVPAPNFKINDTSSSTSKDINYNPYNQTKSAPNAANGYEAPRYYGSSSARQNDDTNSSIYTTPQTANDMTRSEYPYYNNNHSGSEPTVAPKINIISTMSSPISVKQEMAPNLVPKVASQGGMYPQSHAGSSVYPLNHSSVFEHHPEVEGHKPFTELDDFDLSAYAEDDNEAAPLNRNNHDGNDHESDADSDFTSVSQRAPNPNYGGPAPPGKPQGYYPVPQNHPLPQLPPQNQYYQPHSQPQPQQNYSQNKSFYHPVQQRPQYYNGPPQVNTSYGGYQQPPPQPRQPPQKSISDNALAANPDFGLGPSPAKRRLQPGFVPVSQRHIAPSAAASSLMGRGGSAARSGPYGAM